MKIKMIAAIGKNRELGKNNDLLWHLPSDFENFKKLTSGKTIVMGERTLLSLPEKFRPLPGRRTLVLTLNKEFRHKDCEIFYSLESLVDKMKYENKDEIWILGGGQIYKIFLPIADELYLTLVDGVYDADTFFPDFQAVGFKKIFESEKVKSEKDSASMTFSIWEK